MATTYLRGHAVWLMGARGAACTVRDKHSLIDEERMSGQVIPWEFKLTLFFLEGGIRYTGKTQNNNSKMMGTYKEL